MARKKKSAKYIQKGIRVLGAGATGATIGAIEESLGEEAASKAEWGATIIGTLMSIFGTGTMEDVGEVLAEGGATLKGYELGQKGAAKIKKKLDKAALDRSSEIRAEERKAMMEEWRAMGELRPGVHEEPGPFSMPSSSSKRKSKDKAPAEPSAE